MNASKNPKLQRATFGAGCFWGVEETFRKLPGVIDITVGYMGGTLEKPTYQLVCTDSTGHAEVVQVTFDSSQITYKELLAVFWDNHNPTTKNRQGPDVGSQYRSVIFFHSPEQEKEAAASFKEIETSGKWSKPIVTEIVPASTFWKAEAYHQKYLMKRGLDACHM